MPARAPLPAARLPVRAFDLHRALRRAGAAACLGVASFAAGAQQLGEDAATWRALSRLGYGPTPALVAQVRAAGGARAWALSAIDAAFAASREPARLGAAPAEFDAPLPEIFARYREERELRRERREMNAAAAAPSAPNGAPAPTAAAPAMAAPTPAAAAPAVGAPPADAALRYSARLAQQAAAWRIASCSRPELEVPLLARLTEFWFNHLNVSADKGTVRPFVGHYVLHAIRPHVLGRFDELLLASARHPAMLYYLDQAQSVAEGTMQGERRRGLNENYARELMELHTLGASGGYTQADVRELARVLTGWTVAPQQPDGFRFAPRLHDSGVKTVLGRRFGEGASSARAAEDEGVAAIRLLARQPATAERVALRLAQWFVADRPPPALVDRLAQAFQASGGDFRVVMRALVQSPAFWDAGQRLFKTPYDHACAALAAAGGAQDERELRLTLGQLQAAGQGVHRWPTPDGYPTASATWLVPEALTRRADYALALARRAPDVAFLATYAQPATVQRIDAQPARLRAGLLLASPDFMTK